MLLFLKILPAFLLLEQAPCSVEIEKNSKKEEIQTQISIQLGKIDLLGQLLDEFEEDDPKIEKLFSEYYRSLNKRLNFLQYQLDEERRFNISFCGDHKIAILVKQKQFLLDSGKTNLHPDVVIIDNRIKELKKK